MGITDTLNKMFYPDGIKCIVCDGELAFDDGHGVCQRCKLPLNEQFCLSCGRGLDLMVNFCDECAHMPNDFTMARAPFVYDGTIISIVYRLKYGNGRYLAPIMAQYLADICNKNEWRADLITFVPMHPRRFEQRGYDQARLIADALSKLIDVPSQSCLLRTKYYPNFAKMTRKERMTLIKDSIALNGKPNLRDKVIILVDDVFTTGATANECARMLRRAKAKAIFVLTFATAKIESILY